MKSGDVVRVALDRYYSKRIAGISATRRDGSVCSPENDIDATGAERFAAGLCLEKFNDSIMVDGDDGCDFTINGKTVEVVWLGRNRDGKPRTNGHLIVNPHEPQRWADFYFVIGGGLAEGYYPIGWVRHSRLLEYPQKDFGFGMRFAMPISELTPHKDRT